MSRLRRAEALAIPIAVLVLALAVALLLLKYEPLLDGHARPIGDDYSYFLPRLLAGDYWQRLNGWWSIQWFTPGFCGGMPAWANPQSIQFSTPQWLTQLVDPVVAIQLTFALSAVVGASGAFILLKEGFGTSTAASLLGAILFLFNGFFSRRFLAGHLAFHTATWTPWVAWLALRAPRNSREGAVGVVLAGLLVAVMIHGGIAVLLLPIVLALSIIALLLALRGQSLISSSLRLTGALLLGGALSASRIAAMLALTSNFPRDHYPLPGFRTVTGLLAAVFQGLFLRPGVPAPGALENDIFHPVEHEWDFGFSPVPVLLFVAAVPFLWRGFRARQRGRGWIVLAVLVLLIIPLALNFYAPGWNAFLKRVPVVSSNSMLIRWFFAYVPVVPVLTAFALDLLPHPRLIAAGSILVAVAWGLSADPEASEARYIRYSAEPILKAWKKEHTDQTIPRIQIMSVRLRENGTAPNGIFSGDDLVALGASQVFCYEPLFGYQLEKLPWKPLHDGPAMDESNGQLNVKNPACELFPRENHCRPGGQFTAAQRPDADAFLDWSPIPFRRSRVQVAADVLNLVTLAGVVLFLGASGLTWQRRRPAG